MVLAACIPTPIQYGPSGRTEGGQDHGKDSQYQRHDQCSQQRLQGQLPEQSAGVTDCAQRGSSLSTRWVPRWAVGSKPSGRAHDVSAVRLVADLIGVMANEIDRCNTLQLIDDGATDLAGGAHHKYVNRAIHNKLYPWRLGCIGGKHGKGFHCLANDVRHFLGVRHEGGVARGNGPLCGLHSVR
jgi:hypothetical protein